MNKIKTIYIMIIVITKMIIYQHIFIYMTAVRQTNVLWASPRLMNKWVDLYKLIY